MNARTRTLDRVDALLRAARLIADPTHELGQRARALLPARSGLSPQGVDLALAEHFECEPSREALEQLLATAIAAPRCHISLAANVCTAGLRALACALAATPEVAVRPSRRDPVVTTLLVEALQNGNELQAAGGSVRLVDQLAPRAGDAVHLYGSDDNIDLIRRTLPDQVKLRVHGSGAGVAVIAEDSPLPAASEALARDLVAFDGRGCLSPRWTLVAGDAQRAHAFAKTLHDALERWHARVPRGELDTAERATLGNYRRTFETVGEYFQGESHALALDPEPLSLSLPPPFRCTTVAPCTTETLDALVSPWFRYITAVGANPDCKLAQQLRRRTPYARYSPLGRMQQPPLDGPVDRREEAP